MVRCPHCQYRRQYGVVRCPQCDSTFDADQLEELFHLAYVRDRLEGWRKSGQLLDRIVYGLLEATNQEIATLEGTLGLQDAAPAQRASAPGAAAPSLPIGPSAQTPLTAPAAPSAQPLAVPIPAPLRPPTAIEGTVPASPPLPTEEPSAQNSWPRAYQGVILPASTPSAPGQGARAEAPRHPARPAFSWAQLGSYLLSERMLNTLLYLGAFLILASAVVISTFNPVGLSPLAHLASLVATTAVFYGAGGLVWRRLKLVRTGAGLLAIGAAFLPLDIWTLGQHGLLDWAPSAIWLAASLLCLPVYCGTHALLRDRSSAALTALAGGNALLAVLCWLGMPLEWAFLRAAGAGHGLRGARAARGKALARSGSGPVLDCPVCDAVHHGEPAGGLVLPTGLVRVR